MHRLQEGISFGDGEEYCAKDYLKTASERAVAWKHENYPEHDFLQKHADSLRAKSNDTNAVNGEGGLDSEPNRKLMIPNNLERDYWEIVETHRREVTVEYGNDVDTDTYGSGFPLSERGRAIAGKKKAAKMNLPEPKFNDPDYYKETWWNLNNIPCAPDSVLRHVKVGINGINVPWMYYGCLFSTFCWHNEDNYLYSINYHHKGAPKQWYGVPGTKKDSDGLEKVFKSYLSMKMRDVPDLLHHITTMFSPRLLQNQDVSVCKVLQHAGEFVVTFPRAFHGGFSLGPNVGEAVNFATHDWIAMGSDANERYRSFARAAVFSHDRLTFTMANHLEDQKSYRTCSLLLQELERVVTEELQLREELLSQGVRDVSSMVSLPPNRLDQLDEESADYDDKRLCHACKHICFFSAVACECSQSKVSCLRHSHYMCRCNKTRRYLLIWSKQEEMKATVEKVRSHCEKLQQQENAVNGDTKTHEGIETPVPLQSAVAPGVEEDLRRHQNEEIPLEAVSASDMKRNMRARSVSSVPKEPLARVISEDDASSRGASSDEDKQ